MRRLLLLLAGSVLFGLSKGCEAMGDAAFLDQGGAMALPWHLVALVLLFGAALCLLRCVCLTVFGTRRRRVPDPAQVTAIFDENARDESAFDADAALARYLERRQGPEAVAPPARDVPRGFGRKGL